MTLQYLKIYGIQPTNKCHPAKIVSEYDPEIPQSHKFEMLICEIAFVIKHYAQLVALFVHAVLLYSNRYMIKKASITAHRPNHCYQGKRYIVTSTQTRQKSLDSKTCVKRSLKNRSKRRSKVLQNALLEHSAILLTCIKP